MERSKLVDSWFQTKSVNPAFIEAVYILCENSQPLKQNLETNPIFLDIRENLSRRYPSRDVKEIVQSLKQDLIRFGPDDKLSILIRDVLLKYGLDMLCSNLEAMLKKDPLMREALYFLAEYLSSRASWSKILNDSNKLDFDRRLMRRKENIGISEFEELVDFGALYRISMVNSSGVSGKKYLVPEHILEYLFNLDIRKIYECQYCGTAFKNESALSEHENECDERSSDLLLICPHCDRQFETQNELDVHIVECSLKAEAVFDLKHAPFPSCKNPECGGVAIINQTEKQPLLIFEDMLKPAKKFVKVQDNFISNITLERLQSTPKGVDIRILTSFSDMIDNNLFLDLKEIAEEYRNMKNIGYNLQVKQLGKKVVHDRIIIVDDHAWAFSTSIKDVGNYKGSIISYIPPSGRVYIERRFEYHWANNKEIDDTYLESKATEALTAIRQGSMKGNRRST